MCGLFDGVIWEDIVGEYQAVAPEDHALLLEYDGQQLFGYSHPDVAIITALNPAIVHAASWGLLPSWAKDKTLQKNSLNARIESLDEKPMFRNSLNNRCIIPARGFYEWQWTDLNKKNCKKVKYHIKVKDREIFAFAGLYSVYKGQYTFTIVTTDANELMEKVHNHKKRMPVILKKEDEISWLNGADIDLFALPYQVELEAVPEEPVAEQISLF